MLGGEEVSAPLKNPEMVADEFIKGLLLADGSMNEPLALPKFEEPTVS